jgi:choline dehydrogenase-like flavoprotein
VSKARDDYDVIIVGSGAAGGMCALILAVNGVKVLMLEAGRHYDPVTETPMFQLPSEAPLRGGWTPEKPFGFYDATVDGGWQVPGEPYSSAEDTNFLWWRARMLGGRTNHWGRISLRMGEYDFKPRTRDGLGFDWPMTYDDLAPYYDRTEALIGVYGSNEGLENTPNSSPGVLLPPPAPRVHEMLTRKVCGDELDIPVIPAHLAILSEKQDADRLPAELFPGNPLAQRVVGRLDALARRLLLGDAVRARLLDQGELPVAHRAPAAGARHRQPRDPHRRDGARGDGRRAGPGDRRPLRRQATRLDEHASAKLVILAASACESARIMLNSTSSRFPDGVGNASGLVGKYLMDTVGAGVGGQIPTLEQLPPHNQDGASGMHLYMPWWLYGDQQAGRLDFARGYHIEFGGGRQMPGPGIFGGLERFTERRLRPALQGGGAPLLRLVPLVRRARRDDPQRGLLLRDRPRRHVDQWGIPTLKFHWKWSEHELNQARHMQHTFRDIIEAMGGTVTSTVHDDGADAIAAPGQIIHEVGGAIMGDDPSRSVLNEYCQSWEVPNLFVPDGACFVSNADKNPTLSIMAIAWRASDYIIDQMGKGAFA